MTYMRTVTMNEIEEWKEIINFEGRYQVSNLGRIRSMDRIVRYPRGSKGTATKKGVLLKPKVSHGYLEVVLLGSDGIRYSRRVHRLVAEAFIPNPNGYPYINHRDENKQNNVVSNLEWCTPKYNSEEYTRKRFLFRQYDLDRNLIREWNSMTEAAAYVGGNKSGIYHCCNGRLKTYKGFIWKYKDPH